MPDAETIRRVLENAAYETGRAFATLPGEIKALIIGVLFVAVVYMTEYDNRCIARRRKEGK